VFDLRDRVALVTGGASGIGRAIALLFGRRGARVAIVDLDVAGAGRAAQEIEAAGGRALAVEGDVRRAASVESAFARVGREVGTPDILVNSAGVAHVGTVESTAVGDFDRVYEVNVKGVYLCTQAAVKGMLRAGGGAIVNLASIASLVGLEDRFAYSMSKGAVLAMTRSVAADYVRRNIRCNCICPARIHTPFVDGFLAESYPGREAEMFEKLSSYQPIGRMGRPEEVAALALYLCSDEAAFVTGQAYPIDGGVTAL
jgi:NAD(P)-dependent dehydrogenase (short-subunit alcohol dehydrogenase family)